MSSIPTKNDFTIAIKQIKNESRLCGFPFVEILASDLHKKLGHYPGPNHRMPSCCDAMYELMEPSKGDEVTEKPEKGKGAKLRIKYYL